MGAGFLAGSASAAGPLNRNFHPQPEQVARSFDIRPVNPPLTGLSAIRRPGMIAETEVAPNLRLGLGLFASPQSDTRLKPKRKVGLSFSWRF